MCILPGLKLRTLFKCDRIVFMHKRKIRKYRFSCKDFKLKIKILMIDIKNGTPFCLFGIFFYINIGNWQATFVHHFHFEYDGMPN